MNVKKENYLIYKDDLHALSQDFKYEEKEIINWSFIYEYLLKNIINNPKEITYDEVEIKIKLIKKNINEHQLKKLKDLKNEKKDEYTSSQIMNCLTYVLKKKKLNEKEIKYPSPKNSIIIEREIKNEKDKVNKSRNKFNIKYPLTSFRNSIGAREKFDIIGKTYENQNNNKRHSHIKFNSTKSLSPINNQNKIKKEKSLEKKFFSKNKSALNIKKKPSKNKDYAKENDYYFELKGGNEIILNSHSFFSEKNTIPFFKLQIDKFNEKKKDLEPTFYSEFYSNLLKFNDLYFHSEFENLEEDEEFERVRITCDNILTKFNPSIKRDSNLINIEKYS